MTERTHEDGRGEAHAAGARPLDEEEEEEEQEKRTLLAHALSSGRKLAYYQGYLRTIRSLSFARCWRTPSQKRDLIVRKSTPSQKRDLIVRKRGCAKERDLIVRSERREI